MYTNEYNPNNHQHEHEYTDEVQEDGVLLASIDIETIEEAAERNRRLERHKDIWGDSPISSNSSLFRPVPPPEEAHLTTKDDADADDAFYMGAKGCMDEDGNAFDFGYQVNHKVDILF
mmetsp:Transcript_4200/g.4912  ORF Transcript_4200/g.4912 Transcript_4200/m.4912 type:complete len:118 (+) Transcript_4200:177-530(+)